MKKLCRQTVDPNDLRAQTADARRPWRSAHLSGLLIFTLLLATGCSAGRQAYRRGLEAELSRNYDAALVHYRDALAEAPGDIEYRLKVEQARFNAAFQHFDVGRRALDQGNLEAARSSFQRAIALDPTHDLARSELIRTEALIASGTTVGPNSAPEFETRKELARTDPTMDLQLNPAMTGPISLRSTEEVQAIYDFLGEVSGLNVIFDPDFRSTPVSVTFDELSVYEALDLVGLQTRTFWTPLNQNTIVISPDNQQKRRDYEQHVLKTIYFTNSVNPTDITEAITAIRTLLNVRFIAQSTSMNAIIIRDTPGRVAIAEKIIDDIDKSKPEILVEATVLEVDRNRLRELGLLPPQGTSLSLADSGTDAGGTTTGNQVNLRDLDNLNSGSFNMVIPDSVARFLESDTRTRLVQNPSVRASDGQLATIRIGSRVPVASGSFQPAFAGATGTPVVQFQYIDVGVNMDITPRVLLNREISIQIVVQVQATAGNNIISGVSLPVFTNREVTHEIRLSEGETNILGGLITNIESTATNGIPGLNRIPLIGRLFGSEARQLDQTEIIILLTPHIVKMPMLEDRNLQGLFVGTETNSRFLGIASPPSEVAPDGDSQSAPPNPQGSDFEIGEDRLRFDRPEVTLEPGTPVQIDLLIDTADASRVDLTLDFDPATIALRGVVEGGFLGQDGASVATVQNLDTVTGRALVSLERPVSSPPVAGSGRLLALTFEGTGPGTSVIEVNQVRVTSSRGSTQAVPPVRLEVSVP